MNSIYIRPVIQWVCVIIFFLIAKVKRNRIRILPSIFISLSIIFFSFLSPSGKILLTVGSFRITENSLVYGLNRASILVGLVFLSQTIVSLNLKFPGKAGMFINEMFMYFSKLTAVRISFKDFKFKKIIETLDSKLLEIWNEQSK